MISVGTEITIQVGGNRNKISTLEEEAKELRDELIRLFPLESVVGYDS